LCPDLQLLLDEELGRLPDKYRIAIILCDLQQKSRPEVARQLRLPEGTVGSRLARGRAMLAKRLARRGLTVPAGTLAAVLPQQAEAVPTAVLSTTLKGAGLLAAGEGVAAGAISPQASAITEGVMKAMSIGKRQMVGVVFLLMAAVVVAGGLLAHHILKKSHLEEVENPAREADPKEYGTESDAKRFGALNFTTAGAPEDRAVFTWRQSIREIKAKLDPKTGHWTVTGVLPRDWLWVGAPELKPRNLDGNLAHYEAVVYYTPLLPRKVAMPDELPGWQWLTRRRNGVWPGKKEWRDVTQRYVNLYDDSQPIPATARYVSLQAFTNKDAYIIQLGHNYPCPLGFPLKAGAEEARMDATFALVPGLAPPRGESSSFLPSLVSFRPVRFPCSYLTSSCAYLSSCSTFSVRTISEKTGDAEAIHRMATFRLVKGLAKEQGSSFESVYDPLYSARPKESVSPHYYLRAKDGNLVLERNDGSKQFREDATFFVVAPLFRPKPTNNGTR
jgi:hypothetical protein